MCVTVPAHTCAAFLPGRGLTWWWNGIWYPDYNNGYSSNNSEFHPLPAASASMCTCLLGVQHAVSCAVLLHILLAGVMDS